MYTKKKKKINISLILFFFFLGGGVTHNVGLLFFMTHRGLLSS